MGLIESIKSLKPDKDAAIIHPSGGSVDLPGPIKAINKAYNLGFSHAKRDAAALVEDFAKDSEAAVIAAKEYRHALDGLIEEGKRLAEFKRFVHATLDEMDVPSCTEAKANCRIGLRLAWIKKQLEEGEKLARYVILLKEYAALEDEEAQMRKRYPAGSPNCEDAMVELNAKREAINEKVKAYA